MIEIECLIPETLLPRVVRALETAYRTVGADECKMSVIGAVEIVVARPASE